MAAQDWNDRIIEQFRANDGNVGDFGSSLVLMHHIGAKSGTERIAPVMAIRDGDDAWLVTASKAGADDNPAWYHNLLAHPDITIEVPGDSEVAVHVERLEGEARDAGWRRFTDVSDGFRSYQDKTSRTIPVLRLSRR